MPLDRREFGSGQLGDDLCHLRLKASQKLSLVESVGQLECDFRFTPFTEACDGFKDDGDLSWKTHGKCCG